ncbi:hypothetical protein OV760_29585, partial [Salmonella enterica subsp. enterica serovar 1,4,[5],12:i:-]|nr:hypothetical protein [Salmonella enterica subsp. enterica serovar 1,4,[5],12:i:-]
SEPEPKGKSVPRRDALPKPTQQAPTSSLTPQNRQKEQQKEANFDSQSLHRLEKGFKRITRKLKMLKGKEHFKSWTSMRSQSQRMPSSQRTKAVVVVLK